MATVTVNPQAELDKIIAAAEKKLGKGAIHKGSETEQVNHLPFMEPNLNYATEGGAPFGRFMAAYGDESTGKALALDTPIPTPFGWTTMGQLEVGDVVFDERGRWTVVNYTSPVFVDHDCYRVVFDDGSEIIADAEHRWMTSTYLSRQAHDRVAKRELVGASVDGRGKWQRPQDLYSVVTTEEIAGSVNWGSQEHLNHAIPIQGSLVCNTADLKVQPYVLGAWLGDGSSACGEFHSMDEEIVDQIRMHGYDVNETKSSGTCRRWGILKLVPKLRELSVLNNKHIPSEYLRASRHQRRALLQGLMDTAGYVSENGRCEFTTTKKVLSDQVYELICSLGMKARVTEGRATIDGRDVGPKWRIGFTPGKTDVFRLQRKLSRQLAGTADSRRASTWRKIVSCEKVETVPTRCIQVTADSHLFLAGKQMVVTHNTRVAYELMAMLQQLPESAEKILIPRIAYHVGKLDNSELTDEQRIRHQAAAERLEEELEWIRETFPDGGDAVYYNAEQQYDPLYAKRIGIDTDRLLVVESTTIEEIVEVMQGLYAHYPMHVVDSTSSASSLLQQKQEVGKSLMGTDARQWKSSLRASMPFFDPNRNIGMLIHQMSTNIRTGGAQAASTRYLRHTSSCSIKFSRNAFLWEKDGVLSDTKTEGADKASMAGIAEPDGVEVFAKIEKSRTCRPLRVAGLQFDYKRLRFVDEHQIANVAIYFGLALKAGTSHYSVVDENGEAVKIGQGMKKLYGYIEGNPDFRERVVNRLMDYTAEV